MRSRATLALLLVVTLLAAGCTLPGGMNGPVEPTYPREILGGAPWTQLVLEIDHAPGYAPSAAAQTHLLSTMRNITNKDDVRVMLQESLSAEPKTWTADMLVALERETRSTTHAAPTAVMHVLYPAGKYENADAAGVTIAGVGIGPVVVFLDVLRELQNPVVGGLPPLTNPEPAVDRLERSTLLHEAGHGFGLVANGIPMVKDHEDKQHERHSSNERSVMYWAVESTGGLRDFLLQSESVPDRFDAADLADIRSAGGR